MNDTPRTDANARYINGFADQWVPRYVSEDLERELKGAQAQRDRLAEALRKIANEDYRGNAPHSVFIARTALATFNQPPSLSNDYENSMRNMRG